MTTHPLSEQDVLDVIESNPARIRAPGVRRLGLFGSFVRGHQTPAIDVDVLVEFDPAHRWIPVN